jgi:hypothetical protein
MLAFFRFCVVLLFISIVPGYVDESRGDDFRIVPSVSVREEYNDNIFLTEDDKIDDFITTLSGQLAIIERTERLNARLSARVAPFYYADNSDLDDVDQFYRGRVNYAMTPRLGAGGYASYIIDHRPDRAVETTGFVLGPVRRDLLFAGANLRYRLSEITAGSISYDYQDVDFDSEAFVDFTVQSARLGLSRDLRAWVEATTGRFSFAYQRYDSDNSETDSLVAIVGGRHRFSERLSLDLELGTRYTDSTFDTVEFDSFGRREIVQKNKKSFGGLGEANLDYRWERTFSRLSAGHDIRPATGTTGVANRTAVYFRLRHLLFHNLSLGLFGSYIWNKADADEFSTQDIDREALTIRPSIRWNFYRRFNLDGGYTYSYVNNKASDQTPERNYVYLQVSYGISLADLGRIFSQTALGGPDRSYPEPQESADLESF